MRSSCVALAAVVALLGCSGGGSHSGAGGQTGNGGSAGGNGSGGTAGNGDKYGPWAGGASYYGGFANGPPSDPAFFPIAVWLQDPSMVCIAPILAASDLVASASLVRRFGPPGARSVVQVIESER